MLLEENHHTPASTSVYRPAPLHERVLDACWRRKWIGIPVFMVVFILFAIKVALMLDIYQATATILVERQKIPKAFVESTVTTEVDVRWLTMTQQILSQSRLEHLIKQFNLYPQLRQKVHIQEVINRVRKDIQVSQATSQAIRRRKNRNVSTIAFTVSYRSPNPQKAVQVTDALSSFYIQENLQVREKQAASTAEFLQSELTLMKSQLEEQELKLSKFREQNMGELPSQLLTNQATLERLNTQLGLSNERQALLGQRRTLLASQLAAAKEQEPFYAAGAPLLSDVDTAAIRLDQLREQLAALQSTFNDSYPDVKELKKKIASHERLQAPGPATRGGTPAAPRPMSDFARQLQAEYEQIAAEIAVLREQERRLVASIDQYQRRIDRAPQHERQLQILTRNYQTTKQLYDSLLKREKGAKLAENLEQQHQGEQFRLIEPTALRHKPVAPKRSRLLLLGGALATALAIGVIWLVEQVNAPLHSLADLRAAYHSRAPILVSLPYIATTAETRRRRLWFCVGTAVTCVGLILVAIASYAALNGKDAFYNFFVQSL